MELSVDFLSLGRGSVKKSIPCIVMFQALVWDAC